MIEIEIQGVTAGSFECWKNKIWFFLGVSFGILWHKTLCQKKKNKKNNCINKKT